MPGLPSTTSEIESPTGCTKQLMSVAWSWMPAAELMRPAGMKPSSCACRKRRSQVPRLSSRSGWARARATRARTCSTVDSWPFAYFSISVSRQMSCSTTAFSVSLMAVLEGYTGTPGLVNREAEGRMVGKNLAGGLLLGLARGRGRRRLVARLPRALQRIGDFGVPHAQSQLDRRVAFLGDHERVGAVAQQQIDHRQAALHRRVREGRVAVVMVHVRVEVHRQHLLRVHQVVLLDAVEERLQD